MPRPHQTEIAKLRGLYHVNAEKLLGKEADLSDLSQRFGNIIHSPKEFRYNGNEPLSTSVMRATCGAAGALTYSAAGTILTTPVAVVMNEQYKDPRSVASVARDLYNQEGFRAFYRANIITLKRRFFSSLVPFAAVDAFGDRVDIDDVSKALGLAAIETVIAGVSGEPGEKFKMVNGYEKFKEVQNRPKVLTAMGVRNIGFSAALTCVDPVAKLITDTAVESLNLKDQEVILGVNNIAQELCRAAFVVTTVIPDAMATKYTIASAKQNVAREVLSNPYNILRASGPRLFYSYAAASLAARGLKDWKQIFDDSCKESEGFDATDPPKENAGSTSGFVDKISSSNSKDKKSDNGPLRVG